MVKTRQGVARGKSRATAQFTKRLGPMSQVEADRLAAKLAERGFEVTCESDGRSYNTWKVS